MIEMLRRQVVTDLYLLPGLMTSWPVWREVIRSFVSDWRDPDQVLGIADRLKQVFGETKGAPSTSKADEQSSASQGGSAWECLVCWYLNVCLVGTSGVVVKKRSHVKGPITSAIIARYNNEPVSAEADLLGLTFPDAPPFNDKGASFDLVELNRRLAEGAMSQTAMTVIQCKTNWNDSAQIPMLWDLVYRPETQLGGKVSVGMNNYGPRSFRTFRYAFVTVPTTRGPFKRESVAVLRVNALSGGNYWGSKSLPGVAMSLREIFARGGIGPQDGTGVRASLLLELPKLRERYDYFGL